MEKIVQKIIKGLTDPGLGIEAHFCDWNRPSKWVVYTTPQEVEEWVVKRIKEIVSEEKARSNG